MATVYLADDLKHERKVAVKVLKPELAAVVGAERFLAEIKTTANLQHPHILPLYDSGEADGLLFYVMPYVEGESLRGRLDRERQLPVEAAVRIATNMAEALDYAHRHGVVHRDIKPANVLLQDSKPVISDFGIALAVGAAGGGRLTETGLSLGTPHYMSPEQATGDQHVGPATDIYALGCVLYEMLVGEPPYMGATAQAVLGAILAGEIPSSRAKRATVPANVDAVITKALEKVPADRFTAAGRCADALADSAFRHGSSGIANVTSKASHGVLVAACVAFLALGIGIGWSVRGPTSAESIVVRHRVEPLVNGMPRPLGTYTALAPDGSGLVFASSGDGGGTWTLWHKDRESVDAVELPGTAMGKNPVYSPDGEWLAFHSRGQLKTRHFASGNVTTLVDEGVPTGEVAIDWLADGAVLFEIGSNTPRLLRISAAGGAADTIASFAGFLNLTFVSVLPGEQGALIGLCPAGCAAGIDLHTLDLEKGTHTKLLEGVVRGWYVGETGHLVYVDPDGTLYAVGFDLGDLSIVGLPSRLLEGVAVFSSSAQVKVGDDGTLMYLEGGAGLGLRDVVWVDRLGAVDEVLDVPPDLYTGLALSPDGEALAITALDQGRAAQLWAKELPQGSFVRLTTDAGLTRRPDWTPDGTRIGYVTNADAGQPWEARIVAADGSDSGGFETLLRDDRGLWELAFTPDGNGMVYRHGGGNVRGGDLGYADLRTGERNEGLVESSFSEFGVSVSPDGRWLTYVSDASGRFEVLVRPFPEGEGQTIVSTAGGTDPVWGRQGRELFFISADGWMTSAEYVTEPSFEVVGRTQLFEVSPYYRFSTGWRGFDASPLDDRFVMLRTIEATQLGSTVLIQNFFEELDRLARD